METKGYVHVYTGNGKGKTTAAFGLALRALCAGKGVYVGQFVKSMKYNETKIERLFNGSDPAFGRIRIEQLGRGCFIGKDPELADAEAARKGWTRCADLLRSGEYDVVILDELTIALHFGLLSTAVVLDVLRSRHPAVEVVITGRYAPQALIDAADLVTEMCDVKHYYTQGVLSLDELTIALHFGLLSTAVVLDVLRSRHPAVEVVITGRYAPQALIDAADLVTEMCDVKHYYTQGVLSRDGIDR